MFTSSFPFSKINSVKKNLSDDESLIEHVYSFRGKTKKRYIVIVEQYNYFIHLVKFCLQEKKHYSNRFNQLTHLHECSRVITTVGSIIKEVYIKNPYASFGFVGSELPGEEKENTKRFKLYARVVSQLVSPVAFEHRQSKKHSAYLLINRDNHEPELLTKINEMFDRIYLLND